MALLKDIETPSGTIAGYHRIVSVSVNAQTVPVTAHMVVMSYVDKPSREGGKSSLAEQPFSFHFDPALQQNAHEQCYNLLKGTPEFENAIDDI